MTNLEQHAREIFQCALEAASPRRVIAAHENLITRTLALNDIRRINLLAFGKASVAMARAAYEFVRHLPTRSLVIHPAGDAIRAQQLNIIPDCEVIEAEHPVPGSGSLRAAKAALAMAKESDAHTLLLCLISGGGSSLLCLPHPPVTLPQKQTVTTELLRCGATITEFNTVRKHLSLIKGGRLALSAATASVLSLIISDVPSRIAGDELSVIASAPTAADPSTFAEAHAILRRYAVNMPKTVEELFERGMRGEVEETLSQSVMASLRVENVIIASNRTSLEGARQRAESLGYSCHVMDAPLTGDVSDAARLIASRTRVIAQRPACLLFGGETTVNVSGQGMGGRNQELALRVALEPAMRECGAYTFLSAGTDGIDGPTDAAGAIIENSTIARAYAQDIRPQEYLKENNSYEFFRRVGGHIMTGPTGTNVTDIQILLLP